MHPTGHAADIDSMPRIVRHHLGRVTGLFALASEEADTAFLPDIES